MPPLRFRSASDSVSRLTSPPIAFATIVFVSGTAVARTAERRRQRPRFVHRSIVDAIGPETPERDGDEGGEAFDVDRLFVGDHSAIPNALGGQNPTHSGQALALRTADAIHERYFGQ